MNQVKGLSGSEIIEVVKAFLDNQIYDYSILIDGGWGSGKTYFLKNLLKPAIESYEKQKKQAKANYNPKEVLYLSLYGISSIEEITNKLVLTFLSEKVKVDEESNHNKWMRWRSKFNEENTQVIESILNKGFNVFKNLGLNLPSLGGSIGEFIDFKNCILVFDDLERCQCNINEVLGYINNFVEHNGVKVILIANEEEICTRFQSGNIELRYLVAANTLDKENNNGCREKIRERVDLLFNEHNDYKRIKEKLVGNTIRYIPNLSEIYTKLIEENIKNNQLKQVLYEHSDKDVEFSLKLNHTNLRTYQFYLTKINHLYEGLGEYKNDNDILEKVRLYTYKRCVQYKAGIYEYKWSDESLYGPVDILDEKSLRGYILGFKFIDDYILGEYLERNEVKRVIEMYIKENILLSNKEDEPLKIINNWWECDEIEIRKKINEIQQKLNLDKYPIEVYPKILELFINFEWAGFEKETTYKISQQMIHNIENQNDIEYINFKDRFIDNNQSMKRYLELVEPIQKMLINKKNQDKIGRVVNCFSDINNWGENLYDMILETNQLEEKSFIKDINVDDLYATIINSNSKNISMFRYAIGSLYNFSNINEYYKEDITNLETIIGLLKSHDFSQYDLIKKKNLELLLELLEKKAELLNKK